MGQEDRWLDATWAPVRERLPDPPASVLELGCGMLGGHVPRMRAAGYEAVGVDPEAPDGESFRRLEFERYDAPHRFDAVVASTSLHHVADPAAVLDRVVELLTPDGHVVVLEWDWQAFDEPTAQWGFRRIAPDDDASWLGHHRAAWRASQLPWSEYLGGWAGEHGIHPARTLLRLLGERFRLDSPAYGPYLFADVDGTTEEDEQAAITAGEIAATRVEVVGLLR